MGPEHADAIVRHRWPHCEAKGAAILLGRVSQAGGQPGSAAVAADIPNVIGAGHRSPVRPPTPVMSCSMRARDVDRLKELARCAGGGSDEDAPHPTQR